MDVAGMQVAQLMGYLLMLLGLIGAVVPLLPGPFLIWLGAVVWAWGEGFDRIGWPTLLLLLLLAVLAWVSDFLLNAVFSRRAGASWRSIAAAIVGGILGGVLFSGVIPVLGTLFGALIGALGAMYALEYMEKRDSRAALRAMGAYAGSMAVAAVVEIALALAMIALFAWQAFF
jgi:uncharacterized protein YqgC (DUF456 family)